MIIGFTVKCCPPLLSLCFIHVLISAADSPKDLCGLLLYMLLKSWSFSNSVVDLLPSLLHILSLTNLSSVTIPSIL